MRSSGWLCACNFPLSLCLHSLFKRFWLSPADRDENARGGFLFKMKAVNTTSPCGPIAEGRHGSKRKKIGLIIVSARQRGHVNLCLEVAPQLRRASRTLNKSQHLKCCVFAWFVAVPAVPAPVVVVVVVVVVVFLVVVHVVVVHVLLLLLLLLLLFVLVLVLVLVLILLFWSSSMFWDTRSAVKKHRHDTLK